MTQPIDNERQSTGTFSMSFSVLAIEIQFILFSKAIQPTDWMTLSFRMSQRHRQEVKQLQDKHKREMEAMKQRHQTDMDTIRAQTSLAFDQINQSLDFAIVNEISSDFSYRIKRTEYLREQRCEQMQVCNRSTLLTLESLSHGQSKELQFLVDQQNVELDLLQTFHTFEYKELISAFFG